MKSRDGKSRRREEKKKDQKRESLRRKKIQVREKVGKPRDTAFFPMICGSGGSKSRLAKAAGGPDILTALMNMSLVLRLPREMHLCISSSNVPRLPSFLEMPQNPHVLLTFATVHNPLRLPRETTSERPKVLRTRQFLTLLTSKCASPHNRVHLFDISTSKSGLTLVCFVHFDFEMCFAPQRRALFDISTSKSGTWCVLYILTSKCASRQNAVHFFDISTSKSGPNLVCFVHFDFDMCFASFWHFWLRNVLRPTTACTFSTSQLQKVVRRWCVLYILTWKRASRHNGVQFFISHLASWLRTRRFSKPTFRPSGATNHWKKRSVSRLSYLFARLDLLSSETFSFLIFFLLLFSSLTLPISAFHLSTSSEVWLLNFLW